MPRPIAIIICLFLALIIGFGLLIPKYQNLNLLKLRIQLKEAELQNEEEYFSKIHIISEDLKKYEEGLAKISSAFPDDSQLPSLFNFIQKTAAQSGLVLKKVVPAKSKSIKEELVKEGWDSEILETGVNLTVAGSYASFKNFVSTLEKTARIIEIESISFTTPQKEGPIDFNLRIKVYSY